MKYSLKRPSIVIYLKHVSFERGTSSSKLNNWRDAADQQIVNLHVGTRPDVITVLISKQLNFMYFNTDTQVRRYPFVSLNFVPMR